MGLAGTEGVDGANDLLDDFASGETAAQTESCRGAKGAVHGAADLRRDTKCYTRRFDVARHVYRFDFETIVEPEDDARRAVGGVDGVVDFEFCGVEFCFEDLYRFVPDAVMWILGGIPWFLDSAEDVCAAWARWEGVEIFGKCFV